MTNQKLWNRDFSIMVIGQIISLFGNSLLRFALSVYTLRLTGSATLFGTVLAVAMIPTIILMPIGGILADRVSRKRIMVALDFSTAALTAVSLLFLTGSHAVATIIVVLVLLNIIQAFYSPSVQSSVPVMLSGDNIVRGNAVVNQVQALSSLLGPILGGVLSAAVGILPIVLVCAVCFFLSAVLELFLHIPYTRREGGSVTQIIRGDLKTSIKFMRDDQPDVLRTILVVALINFAFTALMLVGMSVLIINILGLSDTLYGIAYGLAFVGSIIGAILSGVLAGKLSTAKLYLPLAICGACIFPIGLAFLLGLPTMVIYGIATVCSMAAMACASVFNVFTLSLVQQRTPQTLQGQVMGYLMAISQCAAPLGQFMYGVLFDVLANQVYILLIGASLFTVGISLGSRRVFAGLGGAGGPGPQAPDPTVPAL